MHAFSSIALTVYTYKMTRTVHSYEYIVPALPKEKKRLVEYKNNVLHQNYNIWDEVEPSILCNYTNVDFNILELCIFQICDLMYWVIIKDILMTVKCWYLYTVVYKQGGGCESRDDDYFFCPAPQVTCKRSGTSILGKTRLAWKQHHSKGKTKNNFEIKNIDHHRHRHRHQHRFLFYLTHTLTVHVYLLLSKAH